jgi:23S rRNA (cytidine1920-2'-O)/16S rRNA (cytidine1409-2'-O)-methyltransferase
LARSREEARSLIEAGRVTVSGSPAHKAATQVDGADPVVVLRDDDDPGYVSRGAHKLAGALDAWPELVVTGRRCLDAGASTGGFTDVLLRRDAGSVIAVDVGYGQLAWSLQTDDRVTVIDRTNVRHLTTEVIGAPVDLIVGDLSFISLKVVLPSLSSCVVDDGDMVLMVKPQFEVGKEQLGSGGVVRDPRLRAEAVGNIAGNAWDLGWGVQAITASPLPGPAGNVEYFLWLRRGAPALTSVDLDRAIEEGPA